PDASPLDRRPEIEPLDLAQIAAARILARAEMAIAGEPTLALDDPQPFVHAAAVDYRQEVLGVVERAARQSVEQRAAQDPPVACAPDVDVQRGQRRRVVDRGGPKNDVHHPGELMRASRLVKPRAARAGGLTIVRPWRRMPLPPGPRQVARDPLCA